mmetsp:Transcript_3746/g.6130  ORF Transcript_3746/g.6130 Transcript_3746/m.6130 type:complete len:103 (-) Transcript_3746:80-388(-)
MICRRRCRRLAHFHHPHGHLCLGLLPSLPYPAHRARSAWQVGLPVALRRGLLELVVAAAAVIRAAAAAAAAAPAPPPSPPQQQQQRWWYNIVENNHSSFFSS